MITTTILLLILIPLFVGTIAVVKRPAPVRTLLFHNLSDKIRYSLSLSTISPQKFALICDALAQSSHRFATIGDRVTDEEIAITFDDGLRSNLTAADILEKRGLPATFFTCTAQLSNEMITDVYGGAEYLSARDIIALSRRGFEIGSHTVHHLDLRLLSDEDLYKELSHSKRELEKLTNCEVISLSIPYGLWDERVVDIAHQVGYRNIVVYNFLKQAVLFKGVCGTTGIYPFDTVSDVLAKIEGKSRIAYTRAGIIPHFAKGSPLAAVSPLYRKLPVPWFSHSKKSKKTYQKED
jgi:peptidoglycan/xylan/chitin deacetylase (PgdA/CDA1 family)